jgi:hypothetical protein
MAEYRDDKNEKRLFYLHDLSDYKIGKDHPDVRGWKVVDSQRKKIGEVESLLVDIKAEKVRYLDVDLDQDILHDQHNPYDKEAHKDGIHEYENRKGETHMIIPIGVAHIDRNSKTIIADGINRDALTNAPTHTKGAEITRDYEIDVLATYRKEDAEFVKEKKENESRSDENKESDEKIKMKDDYFYNQDYFDDACLSEQDYYKNRRN